MNFFVTGGSRGIGRAIVLKIIEKGDNCAFTYNTNEKAADETIKLAQQINPNAVVKKYQLNTADSEQVDNVSDAVISDFENIDAIVNNAAIVKNNAAALMSNEEWNSVINTNLSGPFFVIRSFLMHFISNRKGRIVNISSLAQDGCSGQANYAAAKAGLIGLTKTIAKEYGAKGITSNAVVVGYVETDMTKDNMAEALHKFWLQHCPMKKTGSAEDIANLVYFLSSDEAGFITGEVIRVAGGLTYAP